MREIVAVRLVERGEQRSGEPAHPLERERALAIERPIERLALGPRRHDEGALLVNLAVVEYRVPAWAPARAGALREGAQPLARAFALLALGPRAQIVGVNADADPERVLARLVDGERAARADQGADLVAVLEGERASGERAHRAAPAGGAAGRPILRGSETAIQAPSSARTTSWTALKPGRTAISWPAARSASAPGAVPSAPGSR